MVISERLGIRDTSWFSSPFSNAAVWSMRSSAPCRSSVPPRVGEAEVGGAVERSALGSARGARHRRWTTSPFPRANHSAWSGGRGFEVPPSPRSRRLSDSGSSPQVRLGPSAAVSERRRGTAGHRTQHRGQPPDFIGANLEAEASRVSSRSHSREFPRAVFAASGARAARACWPLRFRRTGTRDPRA